MELSELQKLIKEIPVMKQSTKVNEDSWKEKLKDNDTCLKLFNDINEKYKGEISRQEVLNEKDSKRKIMMTLMWGYPTGGRGNNISHVLKNFDSLDEILNKYGEPCAENKLNNDEFSKLYNQLRPISGLGPSTWSKLLYFFNFYIDGNKCLIYDQKIVSSLNRKQFFELANDKKEYKHNKKDYLIYLQKVKEWAEEIDKDSETPDKIEVFLFYFNLYYKWS